MRRLLAPVRVLLRPASLLVLLFGSLSAASLVAGWFLLRLPVDGGMVAEAGAPASLLLEDGTGEVFAARGALRGEPIRADRLPQPLADAVIAIEDRRFRDHGGVDLRGILRAAWRNTASGRAREGGAPSRSNSRGCSTSRRTAR
jgi:membrane peptidoglycan carboxypeptidase